MARYPSPPDADFDAALRGDLTTLEPQALRQVVSAVRRDATHHGAPVMSAALRAQLTAPVAPAPSGRRRKVLLAGISGLLVGGATLGVAGAQGSLPDGLQDATARALLVVGVDFPDTHGDHPGGGTSTKESDDGGNGSPTPGATPADPGTPGDHEPATPAVPENGKATRGANGNANGSENGTGPGSSNGPGNGNGPDH